MKINNKTNICNLKYLFNILQKKILYKNSMQ